MSLSVIPNNRSVTFLKQQQLVFSEYNQQDATFHNLFISVRRSTCFRRFPVHHQELKTAHTASGIGLTSDGRKTLLKHAERLTEINKL